MVCCIVLLFAYSLSAQETTKLSQGDTSALEIAIQTDNLTNGIKDGMAVAKISGGRKPYTYYWSHRNTDTLSVISKGLTEGVSYTLTVIDSLNNSKQATFQIEAKSVDERINSIFVPVVSWFETVIMADIFALLHLYDPVIYNTNQQAVKHPNGEPVKVKIPFIVLWLVAGAVFFTLRMKFINIRGFKHAIQLIRGVFDKPGNSGEVSHFQALTTALSATVGLGNIAGVAIAIHLGGPGAVLWMILAGLLGMSSKFVECTLGLKYRQISDKGIVSGGPMYYLSRGFKKRGFARTGKVLAAIFAVLAIGGSLGGGNMFQANQAFSQFTLMLPAMEEYGAYFGLVLAFCVGIVIIGGLRKIARVTAKIVPVMAILYVITALVIVFMNIHRLQEAFHLIIYGAFSADAMKGGFIGVMIMGFRRACFSNEAGVGSAPIAHAAAKTKEPVSEGIVALLEPFIDTVVICTMTALVIIFTGYYAPELSQGITGAQLTSNAFGSVFSWFPYILAVAVLLFAFSTMISWSYYGLKSFNYLFARFFRNPKISSNIYYFIFLGFIVVGASSSLGAVVDFSDMMVLSMALPNMIGLYVFSREISKDLKIYTDKMKHKKLNL